MARYSAEELIAEFGAAFLCAHTGIQDAGTEALQASYIEGWSRALKKDPRLIVRAASAAQRAVDFILGTLPAREPTDAADDSTPPPDAPEPATVAAPAHPADPVESVTVAAAP